MIKILVILLMIYVIAESLDPICDMRGGLHQFTHKAKYTLSSATAAALIYQAWLGWMQPVHYLAALTLLFFIWPRMSWRLDCFFNCRGRIRGNE